MLSGRITVMSQSLPEEDYPLLRLATKAEHGHNNQGRLDLATVCRKLLWLCLPKVSNVRCPEKTVIGYWGTAHREVLA